MERTIKLNYLISTQIHERQNLHSVSAHLCTFIIGFYSGSHVFSLSEFGVISRQSSVMIIGGYCNGSVSSLIAKYTIDKWERIGNLQHVRRTHRAIENDDRIYVVGGIDTGGMDTSALYVFLHSIIFKC